MTGDLHLPEGGEVHIWTVALDGVDDAAEARMLSADELDRARRFRLERDGRRFVAFHAALRRLLGAYLRVDPKSVRFVPPSPDGKPRLADDSSRLSFNGSRSQDLGVFAVAHDRMLGIDVERIREDVALEALARRVLTPDELRACSRLEPGARRAVFYRSWTRKEAGLKARGIGLTMAPNEVDVRGDTVELPAPGSADRPSGPSMVFSLHDVEVGAGFVATLAVEGTLPDPPTMCGPVPPLCGARRAR